METNNEEVPIRLAILGKGKHKWVEGIQGGFQKNP